MNGISISDSIVMSVKRKNANYRKPFSAAIAIIGFVSILMSFLGMFKFQYDTKTVVLAALIFTAFYLALAVIGGKAMIVYGASIIIFIIEAYRKSSKIALGFKFIYNIIYKEAYKTEISYYRNLSQALESSSVTALFIFYIWLLAIVIFFFTVSRPNPVLPLMVTFPILELGMYHGIEVPVFWGILCISYWLALLAMSTIDVGEYSGGQSGFVRKNNLFFPKRHMKLKVTEKCGVLIIASVMLIAAASYGALKLTNYKRSDKLNEKRRNITEALEDFSFENFAESFSNLSAAMGFDFEYENHKLGNNDHVRYKNVTDLTVTLDRPTSGAIYLKDYAGAIYKENEWFDLPQSAYNNSLFKDFEKYNLYPQDFPAIFDQLLEPLNQNQSYNIRIKNSQKKANHKYTPYGTFKNNGMRYDKDLTVSTKKDEKGVYKYKFINLDSESVLNSFRNYESYYSNPIVRDIVPFSDIADQKWRDSVKDYCTENDLINLDDYFTLDYNIAFNRDVMINNSNVLMSQLLQNRYSEFIYKNYMKIPNTKEMSEVREHYSDIISGEHTTAEEKLKVLDEIKNRMRNECAYSLYPRRTPSNRDFINYFLLENHKGYCTHFASAGVILARMAGIPARYATGYIIVENDIKNARKNADGSITLDVKDNRSHAWVEVYIDGMGWLPYELTAGYSSNEINTEPTNVTTTKAATTVTTFVTTTTTSPSPKASKTSVSSNTKTNTTTSTNASVSKHGNGGGSSNGSKHLPKVLKNLFLGIFFLALAAGAVMMRRYLILKKRQKGFSEGQASSRVRNMYSYAEKLLSNMELQSEHGNFKGFALEVEKRLGGDYFDAGSFSKFTDIALMASFGQGIPDNDDIKLCEKTINDISAKLYDNSNAFRKFILMFINVLK